MRAEETHDHQRVGPAPAPMEGRRLGPAARLWQAVAAAATATVAVLAVGLATASAQPDASVSIADGLPLTEEALQARIQGLDSMAGDPAAKDEAIRLYRAALDDLAAARRWIAKTMEYEKEALDAPATLAGIEKELAAAEEEDPQVQALPDASLALLEDRLGKVGSGLDLARQRASELEAEQRLRSERRVAVPRLRADASRDLAGLSAEIAASPVPADAPAMVKAKRAAALAHRELLGQQIRAFEAELRSYDARRELSIARVDLANRQVVLLEAKQTAWQDIVNARRRRDAEIAARQAQDVERDVAGDHPALRKIAERNAVLAEQRTSADGPAARIERVTESIATIAAERAKLRERFESIRQKAKAVGFTDAIGLLLRKQRSELPDVAGHEREVRARQSEIRSVQLRLLELEEEREQLSDLDARARAVVGQLEPGLAGEERDQVVTAARRLLEARRGYVDSLIRDYDTYFVALIDLDAREHELLADTARYSSFIDEHVLWIPSTAPFGLKSVTDLWGATVWLLAPAHLVSLAGALGAAAANTPVGFPAACLLWLLLLVEQGRLRGALREACERKGAAKIRDSLYAFALAAVVASAWPLLIALCAWGLGSAGAEGSDYTRAVSVGLNTSAATFFGGELLRQICRRRGLGETHFGWSEKGMSEVRTHLSLAMAVGIPALFVVSSLNAQLNEAWKDSLGRLAFVVGLAVVATTAYRVFRPASSLVASMGGGEDGAWLSRLRGYWYLLACSPPVLLIALAVSGYYFTAIQLTWRFRASAWIVMALVVVHSLVLRWLVAARRKLAVRHAKERREARAEAQAARADGDGEAVVTEEPVIDLITVNEQTRKLLRASIVIALLVGLWTVWDDVLPALKGLDRVELWTTGSPVAQAPVETAPDGAGGTSVTSSKTAVTLADVLMAVIIMLMTSVGARNVPGLLEVTVLQRLPFEPGVRYAVTTVSRYLIVAVGVAFGFGALGLNWSTVQWLVAAMTVGLGFGLQEIFANFVSGLIILFERPIRVGDTVTLGDITGMVSKIRIRATTIVDWDRKELIVPNKEFITAQLINWTLSDRITRVVVPVGIAYGSDTTLAEKLLMEVASRSEHVLADPKPTVLFSEFGDNALIFHLRAFVSSFDHFWRVRHGLHMAIDAAFRDAGIEIAFPQRDLHLRSVSAPIPVELRERGKGG